MSDSPNLKPIIKTVRYAGREFYSTSEVLRHRLNAIQADMSNAKPRRKEELKRLYDETQLIWAAIAEAEGFA